MAGIVAPPGNLIDVKRHRCEAQEKHGQADPAECRMALAQRNGIVQRDGMPQSNKQQNRAPQQPSLPIEDPQWNQRENDSL